MPISVRDYLRLSSAGGLGGAGGGVTLSQVQTEATTAATAVKTELSDADTSGKGANLIAYTKLSGETGVVAPQYPVGDVRRYGARGDGNSRPLSTVYGSLSAAQAVYPHAKALTDELDWAAIQLAIELASARSNGEDQIPVIVPEGHYIVHSPVRMRSNVALIGNGFPIIRSIYVGTSMIEQQCLLTGSFHPQNYNALAARTYNLSNISIGERTITFTTPAQAGNFTVGEPFVIRSTEFNGVGDNSAPVPVFHEANIPVNINVASGVLTLKYPIEENVTAPQAVQTNGSVNDTTGEPIDVIKNITVKGIIFKPNAADSNRWWGNWGAIEATITDIIVIDTLDLLWGNLLCRSTISRMTGRFSNRFFEVKTACSHTTFSDISASYFLDNPTITGSLLSIGEGAHSNTFENMNVDAGGWAGATVFNVQDSYRNIFDKIRIVAPNSTAAVIVLDSRTYTTKLEDNAFSDITFLLGSGFSRYINVGDSGENVSVPKRYRFNNVKFFGTPSGITPSSAMFLVEGEDFEFTDCLFQNGLLSPQNNTKRFKFVGCEFQGRVNASLAKDFNKLTFRSGILSNWKDCFKVSAIALAVNSTTANNVVATYAQAIGARPEDQDYLQFIVETGINGTNGAKTIAIADDTGALITISIAAGTTGPHRISGTVTFRGNTAYVSMFTVLKPDGTMATSRTVRGGMNIASTGRTFTVQGWVANTADSIDFDSISILPVPLLGGMPI